MMLQNESIQKILWVQIMVYKIIQKIIIEIDKIKILIAMNLIQFLRVSKFILNNANLTLRIVGWNT